jgi:hypothetical protein
LQINLLQNGQYIKSETSPNFPNIPIIELIDRYVKQSQTVGRSQAIKDFKTWVRKNI